MLDIKTIADRADIIVNGYAFDGQARVRKDSTRDNFLKYKHDS